MGDLPVAGYYYAITSLQNGAFVDLDHGSSKDGTGIFGNGITLNSSYQQDQCWTFSVQSDKSYLVQNANGTSYMNLTNGDNNDNTPIIGLVNPNRNGNTWILEPTSFGTFPVTGFRFQNRDSGTYLTLPAGNLPIQLVASSANNQNNQIWFLTRVK